jgi:hypothetical protein
MMMTVLWAVFKFLALAEVERLQNGIIPTAISTIWPLATSASAKNLKTDSDNELSSRGNRKNGS